jgi:sec-independent protein translocase protein TatB
MNIGPAEIIVVLVIALLVFGPKRLPQMGRSLGRGVREFRNAAATARSELGLDEVLADVNGVKDDITSSLGIDELKAGIDDVKSSMGVEEITAGVGSVKAAMDFDPRKAAKSMVTGKPAEAKATDGEAPEAAAPETPEASAAETPAAPEAAAPDAPAAPTAPEAAAPEASAPDAPEASAASAPEGPVPEPVDLSAAPACD